MADYGEIARGIVMRNVGEARFEEICRQFDLSQEGREMMDCLMSEWKPDYSLDDVVALCQKYRDYPNIGLVLQAWELITTKAARISTERRHGEVDKTE